MTLTRRSFITRTGLIGVAGAAGVTGLSGLAACRAQTDLTFWYWSGALSDGAAKDAATSLSDRATITPRLINGDFKQQLATALATKTSTPDISGVKGEDMPGFLTRADEFLDLNALGARKIAGSFAAAKYAQATTPDGKQIGLPIDLGPTALFYRADLWAKAGLPTDPVEVGRRMRNWDGWFAAARRLKQAMPKTYAVRNSSDVFGVALAQTPQTFMTRDGAFAGDGTAVRTAWDLAVRSITEGLQAGIYDDAAYDAALSAGTLTGHLGPAWNGLDIESGAPRTAGRWRVAACPGGPANIGGSYLTLPSTCRDPKTAYEYITRLLSPASESRGFSDASIFPAVTATYALPALTRGQSFYGGQPTIDVFGPAVSTLPQVYDAPTNAVISPFYYTELANVEGGKTPAHAWKDAVDAGRQAAKSDTPG